VLEARDLNEAIRLTATHPAARFGAIEIRPVSRAGIDAGAGPDGTPPETRNASRVPG